MDDSEQELERILTEGIVDYLSAEPLKGMEVRILQRIGSRAGRREKARSWSGLPAFGVAAFALAGIMVMLIRQNAPVSSKAVALQAPEKR